MNDKPSRIPLVGQDAINWMGQDWYEQELRDVQAYRNDPAKMRQSLQRRKKSLMENPGKTLAELLPFLPKEHCDIGEAYVREHWDEIEIEPNKDNR